ncbi:TetR/AcrR family transcriptional regulator [Flammeovirgaceae bacterium SG7u.111]|nr:TetR/AcrR family transcriptional regulator [Flammeovirgaceae bacterium SG7u.132]WPO36499.1 TetR/AcrR family transcriptional regulator [Flammeovirgaceae bacterium SG7u.111]
MPRTEEKNREIKEQTRAKIIEASLKTFSQKGYQAASISQIAAEAGMAKGALYHYFKNKEELLKVVILKGMEDIMGMMVVDENMAPKERFVAMLDLTFSSIETNKEYWQLYTGLISQTQSIPVVKQIFTPYFQEMIEGFIQLLTEMGVENPGEEAYIIGGMIDGIILQCLFVFEDYPIEKVKQNIIRKYAG